MTPDLTVEIVHVDTLTPDPENARKHDARNLSAISASLTAFGQRRPIVVTADGVVLAGNGTLEAARGLGWTRIAVARTPADWDYDRARAYALADNRTAELAVWDEAILTGQLYELDAAGWEVTELGFEPLTPPPSPPAEGSPTLADRFVVPPFSVLDARSGPWQDRKRRWLTLGIRSEEGRGEAAGQTGVTKAVPGGGGGAWIGRTEDGSTVAQGEKYRKGQALTLPSLSGRVPDYYAQKEAAEARLGRQLSNTEFEAEHLVISGDTATLSTSGTSIFDPVLCELVYRWFSPAGAEILDPFAGGSVRGVVAGILGRHYTGIDLRGEQIAANREQWQEIGGRLDDAAAGPMPTWIEGDSRLQETLLPADATYDLIFTCPPYADLEVYSDDPRDLSTMSYKDFVAAYRQIIAQAVARLRPDRFAAIVVGEVRDRKGAYYNFVGDTIQAFVDAGAAYYNEAILVTPIGSLAVRAPRQFMAGRKMGKTHQNVLVFVKGDGKRAAKACGPITVEIPDDYDVTLGSGDAPLERPA